MPLFKSSRVIETQIDEFLDTVAEGGLVFRQGVVAYLEGNQTEFDARLRTIDSLERRADKLSREVEAHLYTHSLIPEHRGDVLGLLENTDSILDTAKASLSQFSVEQPVIPDDLRQGFMSVAAASCEAVEALIISARAFFRNVDAVKDSLFKVHHFEKEADQVSDTLKRQIFASDLELAHKIQLRYFAINVETVSDRAEDVANRLAISAIKRQI